MKLLILLSISTAAFAAQCGVHLPWRPAPPNAIPSRFERSIIGGRKVDTPGKWPWQVYILDHNDGLCGGTVIAQKWILTAAHCIKNGSVPKSIHAFVGFNKYFGQRLEPLPSAVRAIVHPDHSDDNINDIALIELERLLIFNHAVSSICLPTKTQVIPADGQAVAIGFGKSNVPGVIDELVNDNILREVVVPIVDPLDCENRWRVVHPFEEWRTAKLTKRFRMKLLILLSISSVVFASQCGIHLPTPSHATPRHERSIIGGKLVTTPAKWPWQVYLEEYKGAGPEMNLCTGTVISEQWILTAAHCLPRGIANATFAITGVTHKDQPQRTRHSIAEVIKHSGYTDFEHDIALLKVNIPIAFNNLVSPICLPSPAQSIPDDGLAVATGFGKVDAEETTEYDFLLREVILPTVPQEVCKQRWSQTPDKWNKQRIICASSLAHGTAGGDSGGPLMMTASDGRWFQIGVTSYSGMKNGKAANGEILPNVFTDVRQYCQWIKENTKGEASCQEEEVVLEDAQILA